MRRWRLRGTTQGVDFPQRVQAAQHQHLARLLENQIRMLLGQQLGFENRFGLRNHRTDGSRVPGRTPRDRAPDCAPRTARFPRIAAVQDRAGKDPPPGPDSATQRSKYAGGLGAGTQFQLMAVFNGAVQALRQVPGAHQPSADVGVIGLQALLLVLGERRVVALQLFAVAIQIGHGLIERQHADVLQQRRQEYLFRQRLTHGIAERARRGRGQQGAAPIELVIQTIGFRAPQRFDQREAQGEGQRGIESQHHQRLAQVFALAALRIQRRIGDAQNFAGQRRVHAQGLGDLAHFDFRILRQLDDVRRHSRRRREIH